MLGIKRIVIAQHERGLLFRNRSLVRVLTPGVHHLADPLGQYQVQVHDVSQPRLEHPKLHVLLEEAAAILDEHVQVVDLGDQEVGLVYENGRLAGVLPPASRVAYWKGPVAVRVERIDIAEDFALPARTAALLQSRAWAGSKVANQVLVARVADDHLGILVVEGAVAGTLPPGLHAFWRHNRSLAVEQVDTRLQAMEVQGQEILTKDKVSLRVNLSASFRVADPLKARAELAKPMDYLYRELQFALRAAVGTRSLDTLLGNKDELDRVVRRQAVERVSRHGLEVVDVGVKDVILPGEMKAILNQVVEAEKASQANVIRRREETAATRSLLNTAKLMEQNPLLLRLKELEALETVTEKIDHLTVLNGLEGVLTDLTRLRASV
jgi:regulator of protease activity HflC (stomatin/prohibitin superfamily)